MSPHAVDLAKGYSALHAGEWQEASAAFEAALLDREVPEALEGLSQASWWAGDGDRALLLRQRAHASFRSQGDVARAVRSALWVSEQYRQVYHDAAASNGWLHRAERLLQDPTAVRAVGWMALVRAVRSSDAMAAEEQARLALTEAERWSVEELEAYALAEIGVALVTSGQVAPGVASLDEAMAAATAQPNPMVAGDVACRLMQAAEMIGDLTPFTAWSAAIQRYISRYGHAALIATCGTCCGQVFADAGDLPGAERELLRTIASLADGGHPSRCSHPAAALASLRVRQGRLEEAEAILAPYKSLPQAVAPAAELLLARGEPKPAIKLLERRLSQTGEDTLTAVPLLSLLVQARGMSGDQPGASRTAKLLETIAGSSGLRHLEGVALLARARSAPSGVAAQSLFEQAANLLEANLPLSSATAKLELAQLIAGSNRELATEYARNAYEMFDQLGAARLADEAAALLRRLGVRGQTGAKRIGRLTGREQQVLELIALGMTNAEIAERLFISPKTAANHVSNILMKLGVRSRTEAAAAALRGPGSARL